MTEHTPGPWNVAGCEVFSLNNDARIAQVFSGSDSQKLLNRAIGASEADANARLIGAAPAMRDALLAIVNDPSARVGLTSEQLDNARAALAKARGE